MTVEIKHAENHREIMAAFSLVKDLAAHEGTSDRLEITEAAFIEAALGPAPKVQILVAVLGHEIIGTATYFERFHIWKGNTIIELDDLYVSPSARGLGTGTRLLKALGSYAKARGIAVKWHVNPDNTGAIQLYKRMGAEYHNTGSCFWRPENI